MKSKTVVVNLKPIDPDKMEILKVSGTKETFKFNLLLDTVPDSVWKDFFNDELRKKPIPLDSQIDFEGESIYVLSVPDKINDTIELVKQLVNSTNEHVRQLTRELGKDMRLREKLILRMKKKLNEFVKH